MGSTMKPGKSTKNGKFAFGSLNAQMKRKLQETTVWLQKMPKKIARLVA